MGTKINLPIQFIEKIISLDLDKHIFKSGLEGAVLQSEQKTDIKDNHLSKILDTLQKEQSLDNEELKYLIWSLDLNCVVSVDNFSKYWNAQKLELAAKLRQFYFKSSGDTVYG